MAATTSSKTCDPKYFLLFTTILSGFLVLGKSHIFDVYELKIRGIKNSCNYDLMMVRMLNVEVRIAVTQDSDNIVRLADELIHLDDWSSREVMLKKSLQDPNCKIYVAEVDGKIVGFIETHVFLDFVEGAPIAIIQNVIIEENYRKLGIGSKLLQRVIEEAEKLNAVEIHVWTEFDNQQAIRFYTKHGFKKRALLLERETWVLSTYI